MTRILQRRHLISYIDQLLAIGAHRDAADPDQCITLRRHGYVLLRSLRTRGGWLTRFFSAPGISWSYDSGLRPALEGPRTPDAIPLGECDILAYLLDDPPEDPSDG